MEYLVMNVNKILRNDLDWKGGIRYVILVFLGSKKGMNKYKEYKFVYESYRIRFEFVIIYWVNID